MDTKESRSSDCMCSRSDGLFVPSRQLSMVVASLVVLLLGSFLAGYFMGKKYIVEQFVSKVEHDSFADQIYSSLCALSEYEPEAEQDGGDVQTVSCDSTPPDFAESEHITTQVAPPEGHEVSAGAEQPDGRSYYAQLIGFGTMRAAERFVARLAQKDIFVKLKKRTSLTPKGTKRTWYQVVTDSFSNRDELDACIDSITQIENLKGIRTVTC